MNFSTTTDPDSRCLITIAFSNSFPWLTRDSGNISWDQKWRNAWRLHSSLSINCLSQPKNLWKKTSLVIQPPWPFWDGKWKRDPFFKGMKVRLSLNHLVFDYFNFTGGFLPVGELVRKTFTVHFFGCWFRESDVTKCRISGWKIQIFEGHHMEANFFW